MLSRALAFLTSLCVLSAVTLLSADEFQSALDSGDLFDWQYSNVEGFELTETDASGAVGGSALELRIPAGKEINFVTIALGSPNHVRFRYRLESGSGQWEVGVLGSREALPETMTELGTWLEYESNQVGTNGWGWRFLVSDVDRVVLLDDLEVVSGFKIDRAFDGGELRIEADREVFKEGEWVAVDVDLDEGRRFLFWGDGPMEASERDESFWQGRLYVDEGALDFDPVTGVELEVNGLEFVVEDKALETTPFEEGGIVQAVALRGESGGVHFFSEYGGYLSYYVKSSDDALEDENRFGGELTSGDWAQRGVWVSGGGVREGMAVEGSVVFAYPSFQPGYKLSLDVEGEGEVEGLPVNSVLAVGERVELTAVPSDGWQFVRWEGTYESESATIELSGKLSESLTAIFAQDIQLDGQSLVSFSDTEWESGEGGGIEWNGVGATSLFFEVAGPSAISFETKLKLGRKTTIEVDGRSIVDLEFDGSVSFESHSFQVESGVHRVELKGWSVDTSGPVSLEMRNLVIDSGYTVDLSVIGKGEVVGLDLGESKHAEGAELVLSANPSNGYTFLGWWGDGSAEGDSWELIVGGASKVTALFGFPMDDEWFVAEGKAGSWTQVEGGWNSPNDLGGEEALRLYGIFEGPAYYDLELTPLEGELDVVSTVFLEDWETERTFSGTTSVWVPEGEHLMWIEVTVEEGNAFTPFRLETPEVFYDVFLSVPWGTLTTSPALELIELPANHDLWKGRLPAGQTLTFEAKRFGAEQFVGWTGALEGFEAEGSVVVNEMISSTAIWELPEFSADEIVWEVDDPAAIYSYRGSGNSLAMTGDAPVVSLKATIEGPGVLRGIDHLLDSLKVTVDGIEVAASPLNLLIDEGEHEVVLTMKRSSSSPQTWFEDLPGIRELSFQSGYQVLTRANGIGSVSSSATSTIVAPGEEVTFEATPEEAAEFGGWGSPFEERSNPFTIEVNEHLNVSAKFLQSGNLGGVDWEFEGVNPTYYEGNWWWEPGCLIWGFVSQEGIRRGSVRGTFALDESEYVVFKFDSPYYVNWISLSVRVDGELLDYSEVNGVAPEFDWIYLESGEHEVEVSFEYDSDELPGGPMIWGRLSLPILDYTYAVEVLDDAVLFEDGDYPLGSTISLEAPIEDADGNRFMGWRVKKETGYSSNWLWHSYSRHLEFFVDSDVQIEPVYQLFPYDLNGVALSATGSNVLELRGEFEGSAILLTKETCDLYAVEATALEWMENGSGDDSIWQFKRRYLDAGDVLRIEEGRFITKLVQSVGWKPNYDSWRQVELGYDENTMQVTLIGEDEEEQSGWALDGQFVSLDTGVFLEVGADEVVVPVFRKVVQTSIGEVVFNQEFAWGELSRTGLEGDSFRWESPFRDEYEFENSMTVVAEGPVYLEFVYVGIAGLKAWIDDSMTDIHQVEFDDIESLIVQVPAGEHEIRLSIEKYSGSIPSIRGAKLIPGFNVAKREYEGGFVESVFGLERATSGDAVEFVAYPKDGYVFSGWEDGDEMDERRTLVLGETGVPKPLFEKVALEIGGYQWDWDDVSIRMVDGRYRVSGSGYLETVVEGPAVLVVANEDDLGALFIGGEPVFEKGWPTQSSGNERIFVGLPEGRQLIRWKAGLGDYYLPTIVFVEGKLIAVKGVGVELSVSPNSAIYELDDEIVVSTRDASVVDWYSKGGGLESRGDTFVFDRPISLRLEGVKWRQETLFELDALVASDGSLFDFDEGGYSIGLSQRNEAVYLKLQNFVPGIVTVELLSGELNLYELDAWLNGSQLRPTSKQVLVDRWRTKYSYHFLVDSPDDEFLLRVEASGLLYGVNSIIVHDVESTQIVETGFAAWFERYRIRHQRLDTEIDLSLDRDGDRMSDYFEYLLDRDPFRADMPLWVEVGDGRRPRLVLPRASLLEEAGIELRARIGGEDTPLDAWLDDPESSGDGSEMERRSIVNDWDGEDPLFFYFSFPSEIPDVDDL